MNVAQPRVVAALKTTSAPTSARGKSGRCAFVGAAKARHTTAATRFATRPTVKFPSRPISGSSTRPPASEPKIVPMVLNRYTRPTSPPTLCLLRITTRAPSGKLAPISAVGGMSNSPQNTKVRKRYTPHESSGRSNCVSWKKTNGRRR